MNVEHNRLYRSRNDRVFAGVCGGLGEYLDIDPVLIRVAWVAMACIKGFGILLYLIWIFVVPLKPYAEEAVRKGRKGGMVGLIFGTSLIVVGFLFLAEEWSWIDLHMLGDWSWDYILPLMLMSAGVWFLLRSTDGKSDSGEVVSGSTSEAGGGTPSPSRKFVRDSQNKKLFGVCGGIGMYLGIDATVIRLLFVVVSLMHPPIGILSYLGLAIFTPAESGAVHPAAGSRAS